MTVCLCVLYFSAIGAVRASPVVSSVPGPAAAVAGFHVAPAPVLAPSPASPGLQGLNGTPGSVKLVNSPSVPSQPGTVISTVSASGSTIITSMASQSPFPQTSVSTPSVALQRHPSPVPNQNGVDLKGVPSPTASTSQVLNHTNPLLHNKMAVPLQSVSGNSVILANTPPPAAAGSPVAQTVTTPTVTGVKPAINGVVQPAMTVVRPPGAPVVTTSIQQQRPGLVTSTTRAAVPQPPLAVRPQQTTIQLPPGFTMPPGESPHSSTRWQKYLNILSFPCGL